MAEGRLNLRQIKNMPIKNLVYILGDDDPGAFEVLARLLNDSNPNAIMSILALDAYGIYGINIWILFSKCCNCDYERFNKTMRLFRSELISRRQVMENINRDEPITFIDDSLSFDGYMAQSDDISDPELYMQSINRQADSYRQRNEMYENELAGLGTGKK